MSLNRMHILHRPIHCCYAHRARLLNVLISMFVFSVMAPIGIGIGTALNSVKAANKTVEMVVAVMQVRLNLVHTQTKLKRFQEYGL